MKTILFFTLVICCQTLTGQITLNMNQNAPTSETNYNYAVAYDSDIGDEVGVFNMDIGGPNASWDLSSVPGELTPISFSAASQGTDASAFSNSDLVHYTANEIVSSERYLSISNGEYSYDGHSVFLPNEDNPISRTIYNDKRKFMTYPITYLEEFQDSFSGVVEIFFGGQSLDHTGETSLKADGYGSLILPYGTIENVLRIKVTSSSFNTFMGNDVSSNTDYQYFWYHQDYETIIASYEEFYSDGSLDSRVSSYISETGFSSMVQSYSQPKISLYPNPSTGLINIEFPSFDTYEYTITDTQGKEILNGSTLDDFSKKVIVNGFETGIYILHASSQTGSYTQRFIIE